MLASATIKDGWDVSARVNALPTPSAQHRPGDQAGIHAMDGSVPGHEGIVQNFKVEDPQTHISTHLQRRFHESPSKAPPSTPGKATSNKHGS